MALFTFADALDSLIGYLGAQPAQQVIKDCRQSIDESLREICNVNNWSYYYTLGRIYTNAPYSTGTVQFQVSSGPFPNYMTLTGGTWPSWTADGYIRINNVVYRPDQLLDPTHITLLAPLAPNADMPAGTAYQIYQDSYQLPADFVSQDQSLYETCFGALQYIHPRQWLFMHRYIYNTGIPQMYTIDADTKYTNRMVVRLAPLPIDGRSLDFIYKRRPRPIQWLGTSNPGTVTLTQGSSVCSGVGTSFDPSMIGAEPGQGGTVLRVSTNGQPPTWMPGGNVAQFEAQVYSVANATSLNTMPLQPSPISGSNLQYVLSDPIDIETGSMMNAFLRCCEHKIGQKRIMKDKPDAYAQYQRELRKAMEADSRSFSGRAEGEINWHRQRMKDMPVGPDQPIGID